jgi:hypothetical protein
MHAIAQFRVLKFRMRYALLGLLLLLTACGSPVGYYDDDPFAPYLDVALRDGDTLFVGDRFEVYSEDYDSGIYRLRVALDGNLLVDYVYNDLSIDELIRVPYAPGWRVIYVEVLDNNFNRASRYYEVYIVP